MNQRLPFQRIRTSGQGRSAVSWFGLGLGVIAAAASVNVRAQDVLLPPYDMPRQPIPGLVPGSADPTLPEDALAAQNLGLPSYDRPVSNAPFKWGPFEARPRLAYGLLYGNGLLRRPGEQTDSFVHSIIPGVQIRAGDFWTLNYSPEVKLYSDERFSDTFNQTVSLTGALPLDRWMLSFAQFYSFQNNPLIETGQQTEQQNFNTSLSAHYQHNTRVSLDLSVTQSIRDTTSFSDMQSWNTMNWLNYQLRDKLSLGVGLGGGFTAVEGGSDMTSERIMTRLNWAPLDKISVSVNGGAEIRQFLDYDVGSQVTPIFGASIQYAMFETTSFSLDASQSLGTSLFGDQVTKSTSIGGSIQQRLLGKLQLQITPSYQITEYETVFANIFRILREDRTFALSTRLSTAFLKKGRISVFYNINKNDSSEAQYDFNSRQTGFSIAYQY